MRNFFETMMGRKFYEGDVPRIAQALEKIGKELENQNQLKEKELNEKELKSLLEEFVVETDAYVQSEEGHGCTWGITSTTLRKARALIDKD